MKKFPVFLCLILSTLTAAHAADRQKSPDPRTMTFRPLDFKVPAAERTVLENGMVVYLLEDHELPLVTIQATVNTGAIYAPAEKTGLALLTGTVLRGGGTTSTTPEALDSELEFMASSIESGIGTDYGFVAMNSLTKNLDRTLEIFSQVIRSPLFREDRVIQAKNKAIEAIRRQNDDPKEFAERELAKAIYKGHPLGRFPTIESVTSISRGDLVSFHKKYFVPNNIILAVSGDFNRRDMLAKLGKVFAGWKKADISFPAVPPPSPITKPEILMAKKDIDQTVVRMGHLGIDKNNPDLYAIYVMNTILGGNGFSSRLMATVREKEGLAYNVESSFQAGKRITGAFEAETETKAGSTIRTIGLMNDIITDMTRRPVSDAELSLAKDSITNSFIFAFTNASSVVNMRVRMEFYGYPKGYLENYRRNIARVTKEDVLRVALKYLHPEKMILVVVGEEKKFDKPLSTLGTVKEIKLDNSK